MLGLAFSEAHRSHQLGLKLRKAPQKGSNVAEPGPPANCPSFPQGSTSFSSPEIHEEGGGAAAAAKNQKRPRRRRRQKKPAAGGGPKTMLQPRSTVGQHQKSSNHHDTSSNRKGSSNLVPSASSHKQHDAPMSKGDLYFALRCGLVATRTRGYAHALGRVTLVNWNGQTVFDAFCKVPVPVSDHRTHITGIRPQDLTSRETLNFDQIRTAVSKMLRGKILIGHGLDGDLGCLKISHPWCDVRDTATFAPYMKEVQDPLTVMLLPRDLNGLAADVLGIAVQGNPVFEATACMELYKFARVQWESQLMKMVQQKEKQREMVQSLRTPEVPSAFCSIMSLLSVKEGESSTTNYQTIKGERKAFGEDNKSQCSDALTEPSTTVGQFAASSSDELSFASPSFFSSNGSAMSSVAPVHSKAMTSMDRSSGIVDGVTLDSAIWQSRASETLQPRRHQELGDWTLGSTSEPTSSFYPNHNHHNQVEEVVATSMTDEELFDHLPSNLLDDAEEHHDDRDEGAPCYSQGASPNRLRLTRKTRKVTLAENKICDRSSAATMHTADPPQHPASPSMFSVFRRRSSAGGTPVDITVPDGMSRSAISMEGSSNWAQPNQQYGPPPTMQADPFFLDPAVYGTVQQLQQYEPQSPHPPPGFFGKFRRSTSSDARKDREDALGDVSPTRSTDDTASTRADHFPEASHDPTTTDGRSSPSVFALFRRRSSSGTTADGLDGAAWSRKATPFRA